MSKAAAAAQFVGVDDGHYGIKVVTESGAMFTVPSRASSGKHLIEWAGGNGDGAIYVVEEGGDYTAHGHLTEYADTRFREYPHSALNRVLVHHALRKAGFAGKEVSIATGLPVSYYYNGAEPNKSFIEGKVENLQKAVMCETGGCARIVENMVTTEAIAAYFDQIIGMDGSPTPAYAEIADAHVGVIDVGGKTTDCAVILPGGAHVDTQRSGSSDVGVLKLNDTIEAMMRSKFKFDMVPPRLIESAVSSGRIKVYGKEEDVSDLVREAKEALADSIMGIVRTKIGTGKDLDFVLLVGGGSIVMRDQLAKHFPHARFPEHPEFANARGMLKIAKYVFGKKG